MKKVNKKEISEIVESLINTPGVNVELPDITNYALELYREKNMKFADAVISSWTLHKEMDELVTFDEADFKKVLNFVSFRKFRTTKTASSSIIFHHLYKYMLNYRDDQKGIY